MMTLRKSIQDAKAKNKLTPEIVAAYAALHLKNDENIPITPAPHHWLWLRLMCDERIKKLLIVAPPESAKTTWALSAYLGCRIGFWPEQNNVLVSASGPIAEKRSLSLRAMVESPAWQATFPKVLPVKASDGLRWTTTEWSLAPQGMPQAGRLHPTLTASGTGGPVVGSRADLAIGDDLLDQENTLTKHQRDKVETWAHQTFYSRRKSNVGRVIMIGTAWHHEDIYSKAQREGGWVVCKMKLLNEGPEVYATVIYPDDWQYEKMGKPVSYQGEIDA